MVPFLYYNNFIIIFFSITNSYLLLQDRLIVNFVSDHSVASNGFRLEWQVDGCGGILRKPTGYLSTPNWPNGYENNLECVWTIIGDLGTKIQLNITEFQLEADLDCR